MACVPTLGRGLRSPFPFLLDSLWGSSVNIGTKQKTLAWPMRKDDTRESRSVIILERQGLCPGKSVVCNHPTPKCPTVYLFFYRPTFQRPLAARSVYVCGAVKMQLASWRDSKHSGF
jgi:hypothetical protein